MTLDAASAVAALVAAKEIEALEDAIAKASYLDNTPGEDRQKLRGERARGRLAASPSAAGEAWEPVITLCQPVLCALQRRARG